MATAVGHYRIGDVASRVGLTERTIRYYEELGLLDSVKRLDGGVRVYTDDDVRRLKYIRKLKVLGLSLQEMHELESMYQRHRSNRTGAAAPHGAARCASRHHQREGRRAPSASGRDPLIP